MDKSISNLEQLQENQQTDFQNKIIQVVAFSFNKEFVPIFSQKKNQWRICVWCLRYRHYRHAWFRKWRICSKIIKLDTKQLIQSKQIDLNKITKLLWLILSRNDFTSLIKDVVNNLDNKNYQTAINKDNHDLQNAEKFLLKIATENINENKARKLYEHLIEPKVDKLTSAIGKGKDKRNNVSDILNNIKLSIFEGCYYYYFDKPKITEESIAERTKLRRQRLNMVKEKEKNKQ